MADETRITPYRNGPYLVRGPFVLVDQDGNEIEVKRRVIALCRCGRSRMRPFCDGTHKGIRFRAESGVAEPPDQAGILEDAGTLAPGPGSLERDPDLLAPDSA